MNIPAIWILATMPIRFVVAMILFTFEVVFSLVVGVFIPDILDGLPSAFTRWKEFVLKGADRGDEVE